MDKCNRCGEGMDDFEYRYENGRCVKCKHKVAMKIGLVVALICLCIAVPIGFIQYDYELGKCGSLKSSETSYGFTHNVELDANYNQECYRLRNHPLVPIEYILIYPLMFSIIISLFGYAIGRFK